MDTESVGITFELLRTKFDELKVLNNQIYELVLGSSSGKEMIIEIERCEDCSVTWQNGLHIQYRAVLTIIPKFKLSQ